LAGTIHLHDPNRSLVNMVARAGTEQGYTGIRRPWSYTLRGSYFHGPGA